MRPIFRGYRPGLQEFSEVNRKASFLARDGVARRET